MTATTDRHLRLVAAHTPATVTDPRPAARSRVRAAQASRYAVYAVTVPTGCRTTALMARITLMLNAGAAAWAAEPVPVDEPPVTPEPAAQVVEAA